MNLNTFFSNAKTWASYHKPEIFSTISILTGAGAVAAAFIESPKTHEDWKSGKEDLNVIREKHLVGQEGYSDADYKKDLMKTTGNIAATTVKDMKFTIGLELASIGFGIAGIVTGANQRTAFATMAASSAGLLAFTEESIRDIWGEDGLKMVKEKRVNGINKTVKTTNPETGKKETHEIHIDAPDMTVLDSRCAELLSTMPPEVRAAFDLSHCIVIDETNTNFKSCNGNIDLMVPVIKNALNQSNIYMWKYGRISVRKIIDELGYDTHDKRFNQDILDMAGTIDCPTAYDMVSGKLVRIKGFDDNGIATERYGEISHKELSFGEEQDKFLFCKPEAIEKAYFIIDGKIILNLSYDGCICTLRTKDDPDWRRKAWIEHPEIEK